MALVLTRRIGETICIGADIKVTIMEINGNQVRVGIAAPRNVIVDREEITERKRLEARSGLKRSSSALTPRVG